MTTWEPTHHSTADGSTVRLVSAEPFTIENENGDQWTDDPSAWKQIRPGDAICPDCGKPVHGGKSHAVMVEHINAQHEKSQKVRLNVLFSSMPYSALRIRTAGHDEEWTLDMVEENLIALRDNLQLTAQRERALQKKVDEYEALHAGLRRFAELIIEDD
jgi:hypothetical protein